MMLALVALLQSGGLPPTYSGRAGELRVEVPRFEGSVTVDGALDEPEWGRAARLTGFSEYAPVDGRPAEDSTEVLVWYSGGAIYFGIRAFEPHGSVHATLRIATRSPPTITSRSCSTLSTIIARRSCSA